MLRSFKDIKFYQKETNVEQTAKDKALELVYEMERHLKSAGGTSPTYIGGVIVQMPLLDPVTGIISFKLGQVADVAFVPSEDGYRQSVTLSSQITTPILESGIKLVGPVT